ncbi:IclR family transcriptional regulator [Haloferax sp. ATB1]|uniref:IclR family transcriptional regulator n=1 Tax=Haloferax sp. ATB1 TaxID=1508454 RepID=UPI000A42AD2D|nr:helix-turn-helix domain-containing protein [Haloferax sp. ATB1]
MTEKATRPIRSDETLLAILEALEAQTAPSVSDVATHAGVSKSTAHNHLSTLREHGYVVDGERGYELSLRFLELGESARTNTEIYEVARPHADELSRETGLLVNISVEDRGKGVYLYRTRGDDRIRLSTRAAKSTSYIAPPLERRFSRTCRSVGSNRFSTNTAFRSGLKTR